MPNLQQIQELRKKYSKYGINNSVSSRELKLLTESFNRNLGSIKSAFNIQGVDDHIIPYFEQQKSADVILLFIDISNFSKKCETLTNSELSNYLDAYYDIVVPTLLDIFEKRRREPDFCVCNNIIINASAAPTQI